MIHLTRYKAHALVEGALPDAEEAQVHAHLASCAPCRRCVERERALLDAWSGLPDVPVPDGFAERVMAALPRPRSWALTWFAATTATLAATSLGIFVYVLVTGQNLPGLLASLNRSLFLSLKQGVLVSARLLKFATTLLGLLAEAVNRAGRGLDVLASVFGLPGLAATVLLLLAAATAIVVASRRKSALEDDDD